MRCRQCGPRLRRPLRAECLHGVWDLFGDAGNAPTVFPAPIALAAAFDAPLLARVAGAIADETRAKANIYLARENKVRWATPAARARRRRAGAGSRAPCLQICFCSDCSAWSINALPALKRAGC